MPKVDVLQDQLGTETNQDIQELHLGRRQEIEGNKGEVLGPGVAIGHMRALIKSEGL